MGATEIGRRVGLLSVLTGLLAVVAVASRFPLSSHVGGSGLAGGLAVTLPALFAVAAVAGVVLLVLLASLFRGVLRRRSPDDDFVPRQPPIPAWKALPLLAPLVAFALAAIVVVAVLGRPRAHPQPIAGPATPMRSAGAPAAASRPAGGSGLELSTGALVAGAGLAVVLLGTALSLGVRARRSRVDVLPARDRALVAEIDEAIADLTSGSSPRRSVIGAYVRMERVLAERALPHRAAEAPREYLARALAALGAGAASAARLTELFEEATFSPHEIGEPMRDDALKALGALRATLAGER